MAGFFTLKSSHTMFLIIVAMMAIPVIVNLYYPAYLTDSGYVAIGAIMALIFGLYLNAVIQGPRYPHIEHSIYDSVTGIAFAIKDFFIDAEPEPGAPIIDVWPLNKDKEGNAKPMYIFGRWWYPYLSKTHWPVDGIGDFGPSFVHIFVLPHPWKAFLGFGRRADAAYLTGEVISHGTSTHLDSILAPFKVDYVGLEIPVYLGIFSTYTIHKITEGWEDGMKELARILTDMNGLIEQEKEHIFPKAQLEDMVAKTFEEIQVPGVNRRTQKSE